MTDEGILLRRGQAANHGHGSLYQLRPQRRPQVRVPFDEIAAAAPDLVASGPTGEQDRIRVAMPTLITRDPPRRR
jgi:hypothetical protein